MRTDDETGKTKRYPLIVSTGGPLTVAVYLLVPEGCDYETNSAFVLPKTLPEFLGL